MILLCLSACSTTSSTVAPAPITTPSSSQGEVQQQPTIQPPSTDQATLSLEITPNIVEAGTCARLRYRVTNLNNVVLDGEPVPIDQPTGSVVLCPEASRSYVLMGQDDIGSVYSQTATLTVARLDQTTAGTSGSRLVSTTPGCQLAIDVLGIVQADFCRFSPGGNRIAVPADDGGLWIMRADGEDIVSLVNPSGRFIIRGNIVWSPDGTYIAFSTVGLDGLGQGVGYYNFANASMRYIGPDGESGLNDRAENPRWTTDGKLLITWYETSDDSQGQVSIFGPYALAPEGPVPLAINTELQLDAGYKGQQTYPWQPGRPWQVGEAPSYEVD